MVGWSVMCGRFCGACDSRCGCESALHNNAAPVENDGRGIASAAMWSQSLNGVADPISASCWIRQSRIQNRRPLTLITMPTQLLRIPPSPTQPPTPTVTQPPRMPLRLPTPAMTRLPRVTDRSYRNR